jgi:acyl-CoA synthetase (NDP forming)
VDEYDTSNTASTQEEVTSEVCSVAGYSDGLLNVYSQEASIIEIQSVDEFRETVRPLHIPQHPRPYRISADGFP